MAPQVSCAGREKKLAIGTYPEVSFLEARKRRDEARELIAAGGDPSREKQRAKARAVTEAANTFDLIAREYFDHRKRDGQRPWAEMTANKAEFLLNQLRSIGDLPVAEIEPSDILACLRKVEARGNQETARRALQMAGQVFRFAVATTRLKSDPTRDLRGALRAPARRHHAAVLDPVALGAMLRAIDGYAGNIHTRLALQFAPLVFVRPGELRQARWEHIDFDAAVWSIPPQSTKMRKPHRVPLSRQALEILQHLKAMTERIEGFVFLRSGPVPAR